MEIGNISERRKNCYFVNKEEADLAFKQYKKEIIDSLLLSNGFYKYKTNAYVRLNGIGLLEYIDLQKKDMVQKHFV